ncbi:MAG: NYN domain-containing protein [Ancalomicrobiaceae bacterium]|nr:NYN domain-containing protein [Ancalomicrobiaceae bacterium]
MTDAIRSVLFVDFDNVFFSLQSADKDAAKSFANDPRRWLEAIESGSLIEAVAGSPAVGRRRILMRRCYANPAVMRYFRGYFTRSGFQIVDCPPLTGRGKNSADIYMVVDMLDALRHETHFDEFIILSGDADFTPVLLRLRAYDRSSIIYSNAVTATAYKSLCDGMITEERLIDLTAGPDDSEEEAVSPVQGPPPGIAAVQPPYGEAAPLAERRPDRAVPELAPTERVSPERASAERASSERPPPERLPPERATGERAAPERLGDRARSFERRRAPQRMAPETPEAAIGDLPAKPIRIAADLAGLARRVNAATNVPMFASEVYAALFKALASEVRDNSFSFNRTVNAVIRRLGDAGLKLRPQHVAFVVKGLMLSGHEFVADDTPASLAKGFRRQVLYLCANEDLTLTETERGQVGLWIVGGLRNLTESEILTSEPVTTDAARAAELANVDPDADQMSSLELESDEDGGEADGERRPDDPGDQDDQGDQDPGDDEPSDEELEDDANGDDEGGEGEADEGGADDSEAAGEDGGDAPSGPEGSQAPEARDGAQETPEDGGKPRVKLDDLLARMRSPSRN